MTLRFKVALFVSTLFVVFGLALYLLFNATVMQGFLELEQENALHHTARAQAELQTLASETGLVAGRLGGGDDAFAFVQGGSEDFKSNLNYRALAQLGARHVVLTTNEPAVLWSGTGDSATETVAPLDDATAQTMVQVARIALARRAAIGGLLKLGEQMYLVGAAPVVNPAGDGMVHGAVVVTQLLGEPALERLRSLVRGAIRVEKIEAIQADKDLGSSFTQALRSNRAVVLATSLRMYGLEAVKDVFGTPVLALVTGQTRDLLLRGIQARNLVLLCVIAFTLVGIVTALALINRGVVAPLRKLAEQAKQIGEQQTDSMRVDESGDREISALGAEINKMLDQLSLSKLDEITARKSAESETEARTAVIYQLSQELRISLTTILGMHHMLLKEDPSEKNREHVAKANKSAWELVGTINKLLNLRFDAQLSDSKVNPSVVLDEDNLFMFARKLRVLLADDTPTNRIVLEEMLTDAGHHVESVDDGAQLVERLSPGIAGAAGSDTFDIVLTDIGMPNMDGYEATRTVRELESQSGRGVRLPIIAVTAHAMKDEQDKMVEAGVDGIITKPIYPAAVSAEFRRLLPALISRDRTAKDSPAK